MYVVGEEENIFNVTPTLSIMLLFHTSLLTKPFAKFSYFNFYAIEVLIEEKNAITIYVLDFYRFRGIPELEYIFLQVKSAMKNRLAIF